MKGAPVAYELQQEYGGLGMLYVKPAYRKRGLGKLVTNFLLQKCADHGYPPYALIADDNEESGKLHTSIGFQKKDLLFIWSNIHPKTNEKWYVSSVDQIAIFSNNFNIVHRYIFSV